MANFALYANNPTVNSTDGTKLSSDGSGTSPLTVILNSTSNESKVVKCAIRCDPGYLISDSATISFTGDTANRWQIALDDDYESAEVASQMCQWYNSISISSINSVNKIFWVKVSSVEGELPQNDSSVLIHAFATVSKED